MEVVVRIDDTKFEEFKSLLDKFKADVVNYPEDIIVSSVEEIRQRIMEAENDEYVSEKEENEVFEKLYKKYSL